MSYTIGWSGLFKGRVARQWKFYMEQHLKVKGIKLQIKEWAPQLINAMWDHTRRLRHYHDDAVHNRD
jgi:hypothetical protein